VRADDEIESGEIESGEVESGEEATMRCPYCRHPDSRVVDSREAEDGALIRRRRSCPECGRRFTTVEEAVLAIVKRSGVTEPFSRTKIIAGVRKACQGRPVDEDSIALLAQRVEEAIRARGAAEVPSHEVGLAILGPLRELDEVAYLRFASVYRSFESLADFEREIAALREREPARPGGHGADPERGPTNGRVPERAANQT
jgi:transcriptional repressor NrdR